MIHDIESVSKEKAVETIKELNKTRLNGAVEFGGDFVFQIEGVPRAFTHQAVRKRVGASYSQESMRFATKEGNKFSYATGKSIRADNDLNALYGGFMNDISQKYEKLLSKGAEQQDARGILPINTNTKIGIRYNLMTLIRLAEVRLCYQSQGHWRTVIEKMKKEVKGKVGKSVADLLVKACDRTGKCEFISVFDRDCPVEEKLINNMCESCEQRWECDKYKKDIGRYCAPIEKLMMKEE